jgi:catechol 2,3-dioxygenase-like lactoylglutathione lyase family enzyme
MKGRINHLMLNVNHYDEAKRFYAWLLPKVGYPNQTAFAEDAPKRGSG